MIKQSGADILRLWVSIATTATTSDSSQEILARAVEAYRKIRNTFRYLLVEPLRLRPGARRGAAGELLEVDRYTLARYAERHADPRTPLRGLRFPAIFHALNTLMTVDLSAFYLDVSKDRLYTLGTRSHARRSGQTAIYQIADGLARLSAPILSMTAEEVWRHLPGRREGSVHLALFPERATSTRWTIRR